MLRYFFCAALAMSGAQAAFGHEIYSGLRGKSGQLCCGGEDCAGTIYRERGDTFEFLTREKTWVAIPKDRITFLPVPGDASADAPHRAHLCYRIVSSPESASSGEVFLPIGGQAIFLYCAFISPQSM
jgi:hypothetical protein